MLSGSGNLNLIHTSKTCLVKPNVTEWKSETELKDLIFHRDQVIELSTCIFSVLHLNSTNIRLICFMKKTNHVQLDNCKALLSFDVNGALVRISLIFGVR